MTLVGQCMGPNSFVASIRHRSCFLPVLHGWWHTED